MEWVEAMGTMNFPLLRTCPPVGPDRINKEYAVDLVVSWEKKRHRKEELEGAGICLYFIQRAPLTQRILKALRERSRGRMGQRLWLGKLEVWGVEDKQSVRASWEVDELTLLPCTKLKSGPLHVLRLTKISPTPNLTQEREMLPV